MRYTLNFIFYLIYTIRTKFHFAFNRINPGKLLFKIPLFKKRITETEVEILKSVDETFTNKEYGVGVQTASAYTVLIFAGFLYLPITIVKNLIGFKEYWMPMMFFVGLSIVSWCCCYFFVFRKNLYIKYLELFEGVKFTEKLKFFLIVLMACSLLFLVAYMTS